MRLIDADEYEKRIKPYDTEDAMDKALYNFAHTHLIETSTVEKKGKWIRKIGMVKCDQCLRAIRRIDCDGLLNFCPNCGAKMMEDDMR